MGGFYSNALVVVVLPHQDLHGRFKYCVENIRIFFFFAEKTFALPLSKQNTNNRERTKYFIYQLMHNKVALTLRLLMSYIYGAPSKARNATVVYIWTYVWQR